MSMSTEVAPKKTTARQESARQLKEAEWKKSFLRDCDTKSTESTTNTRTIQGEGETLPPPKLAKPKKPREKKPADSTPKKNAQRAKGSIALNKAIEQTDAEPKPEKRTLGESIDKQPVCKTEEPKTPVSAQRRRKKVTRGVGDKAEKTDKKCPGKGKPSVVKEPSCESIDEETLGVVSQEAAEVKSDEIRAVSTSFNSCSFFEKLQQGVKAYFSSRSSFNPEDSKKKEGGTRGSVDGVTEDVKTRKPGLNKTKNKNSYPERDLLYDQLRFLGGESSTEFINKPKILRHFRKLKRKKLYHPKKYYVRIQIPRKGYFYRSTVGLQSRECTTSDSRGKTKADSKSQISELAPASFKTNSPPYKMELKVQESTDSDAKFVDCLKPHNPERPLYGFSDEASASNFEQSVNEFVETNWPGIGRDVGEDALEEIDNFRTGGERQISAISENLHKIDSQKTKYELFGDGESDYGFPNGGVKTTYWNSLQSMLQRDQFVYSLEVVQQPKLPKMWESSLHIIEEEPPGSEGEIFSSSSVRVGAGKSYSKTDEISTLMGGVDLHLELENYLKAIENSPTTKSRTKNTLQCNFYDNYIPLQIYSSSQDLQGRAEEYFDVPENKSDPSINSTTPNCTELEEVANEVFLNVKADQEGECRNAILETRSDQNTISCHFPYKSVSWENTMDGYEKIYPIGDNVTKTSRNVLFRDSLTPILQPPQRSSLLWSPTLQELIEIYNSVLKQNKKLRRNSLLANCSSSHLFSFLKEKLRERHCKRDLINLSQELRNSHIREQKNLGKPERGPPDSVTLEEYVAMFQEILQSSLSINQITRLNDIISGLQTYSEGNYNAMRDVGLDPKNMTEQLEPPAKPPSLKPQEGLETPATPRKKKKVRFETSLKEAKPNPWKLQHGETETKPRKSRKSNVKSYRVKSAPKDTQRKRAHKKRVKTLEGSKSREIPPTPGGLEFILNTLFGMETQGKVPEMTDSRNKLLVNVQLHGSQVLMNGYSCFRNEEALSGQKSEQKGTSELIIENVTKNEMPFDLWWKNTKSSRLRIMGSNYSEKLKSSTRKPRKETWATKRRQETRSKRTKAEIRKPEKKIANFRYSQALLRAQHPMGAIAEISESNMNQVEETNHRMEGRPRRRKILLEEIPISPMALKGALKTALKKKVFSKDLISNLICSEKKHGKTLNRLGPCQFRPKKRCQTAIQKKQAVKVRSMVDTKKNPSRKSKGRKIQSRRNTFLCYSSEMKISKPGNKKQTWRVASTAASKMKQTRSEGNPRVNKKMSKKSALKSEITNSKTPKSSAVEEITITVEEPIEKERPWMTTFMTPILEPTTKEKPSVEVIEVPIEKATAVETETLSTERIAMPWEKQTEKEKQWMDRSGSGNELQLLFSEGKGAEDQIPEDDLSRDRQDSFVSIHDEEDSSTESSEAKAMGSWFALLPPAGCLDCVSLLTEMIHSDSFLVNFPHHGISQTKLKPLLKCNSDMKFYPGCLREGRKEEKPLLTFVLTPSQQANSKLPENQVMVVKKETVSPGSDAVTKNGNDETHNEEDKEKTLKSIEEFIKYLSKSRKVVSQSKSPDRQQKERPKPKPLPSRVVSVTNRLCRSPITSSRFTIRECQKRRLAKLDAQLNRKKTGNTNPPMRKKPFETNQKATDPILNKMIKNLSHTLECFMQKGQAKKEAKKEEKQEEDNNEANITGSDILPEVVEAIKTIISTMEGIPHKEELISMIGDGLFRTQNLETAGESPAKKTTAVKIKVQCSEQTRKEELQEETKEEKPSQVGQPEAATDFDLLDTLVSRETCGGDLKRINSTYFDAIEKTAAGQMSGDSIRSLSPKEGTINLCAEFGVEEENKFEFAPSDEQLLPKDVPGKEFEELIYEKITKSLECGKVTYSMALLEAFLEKSEYSDCSVLKKMLALVQEKSKNIMLSMERKAWLKVLSSLDEIFLALENDTREIHLKVQLETTKQFIDKIKILNTKRLDALQKFCSTFVTSLQDDNDHSENVFDRLKRSLKLIKHKFALTLNSFALKLEDRDVEETSDSSSGIKLHATSSLPEIKDHPEKRKTPNDPQELKKKLQQQYDFLRQLTEEDSECTQPEIQDVKEEVAEKLKLLEKVFECPSEGESSSMEANYWGKATSLLRLARTYRLREKDGEDVQLNRSRGYVDLMRCLIKAWDTRTTMGSIANDCFL